MMCFMICDPFCDVYDVICDPLCDVFFSRIYVNFSEML